MAAEQPLWLLLWTLRSLQPRKCEAHRLRKEDAAAAAAAAWYGAWA